MINQELLDYVQKQLESGAGEETIKTGLLSGGWNENDINEALGLKSPASGYKQTEDTKQAEESLSVKKRTIAKKIILLLAFLALAYLIYSGIKFIGLVKEKTDSGEIGKPREEKETEVWNEASLEDKEEAAETVNQAVDVSEQRWLAEQTDDQTKQAMKLPVFWNSSVEEVWFVCQVDLPSDFLDQINNYRDQIVQNNEEVLKLKQQYPDCIDENYFFNDENGQCDSIKDQFRQFNNLYLEGSVEGKKYIESFCERSPFWSTKINPTQHELLLGE